MSDVFHTPGPWMATPRRGDRQGDESHIVGAENEVVAFVHGYVDHPRNQANARLIAAAPDLLNFVRWVADRGEPNNQMAVFKRARSLVAKAEGRAP